MKILLLMIVFYSTLLSDTYYYSFGKKVKLTKLKETRIINDQNITYYKNSVGQKLGVKNEILTKCKEEGKCQKIFAEYNLTQIKNLTPRILLITLKKGEDPFEISQKLFLEDMIEFAHPNFIKKKQRR